MLVFTDRINKQESRAITGRTARCRCKFRYLSNFTISRQWNVYVCYTWQHAKVSTKHLESRLQVIQGHAFWDHWKADDGLRITV